MAFVFDFNEPSQSNLILEGTKVIVSRESILDFKDNSNGIQYTKEVSLEFSDKDSAREYYYKNR